MEEPQAWRVKEIWFEDRGDTSPCSLSPHSPPATLHQVQRLHRTSKSHQGVNSGVQVPLAAAP